MKRLDLSIDELRVESFETTEKEAEEQGTVHGHHHSRSTCWQRICDCTNGEGTACDYSCGTCLDECATDASCPTQPGYRGCHRSSSPSPFSARIAARPRPVFRTGAILMATANEHPLLNTLICAILLCLNVCCHRLGMYRDRPMRFLIHP